MMQTKDGHPAPVPAKAGLIDEIPVLHRSTQRENNDKRQRAKHAGYEEYKGANTIDPQQGF
jgi:hypothetical protein